jgi:hypothetical protein
MNKIITDFHYYLCEALFFMYDDSFWISNDNIYLLYNLPSFTKKLYCNGIQLTELPPLHHLRNLKYIYCYGNQLTTLPELPSTLEGLFCSNNQITTLPVLPPNLKQLWCENNQLTTLPELPSQLEKLRCHNNRLITLPELPINLYHLECTNNQLTSLPELPPNLLHLLCGYNQISVLPELPSTLLSFICRNNRLAILPILPHLINNRIELDRKGQFYGRYNYGPYGFIIKGNPLVYPPEILNLLETVESELVNYPNDDFYYGKKEYTRVQGLIIEDIIDHLNQYVEDIQMQKPVMK